MLWYLLVGGAGPLAGLLCLPGPGPGHPAGLGVTVLGRSVWQPGLAASGPASDGLLGLGAERGVRVAACAQRLPELLLIPGGGRRKAGGRGRKWGGAGAGREAHGVVRVGTGEELQELLGLLAQAGAIGTAPADLAVRATDQDVDARKENLFLGPVAAASGPGGALLGPGCG